ncbi:MAG: 3-hydroxyacyl-ACP dehydratase FabZ [Flexistipes sinusarabici]|uniref:3-hydroxyacyl-[acyl-carrier-protein] dehydratase FabZ n=1 Tax=Flexistipes sinusarabici TaxID=2352 RepID=A0A5D0MU96_FLESI|nr:3-hydroxyacyl-ACP dehydratase FabZ [Flexistipes sinusarabici]TYB35631.1 MAG: 3-hydroxyacyl-ACP dehydratase FabZ [Flexistipes sinusarabici]
MNIKDILSKLPHRYPFLLVDRVLKADGDNIKALKNVTFNEHFFQGHFPDNPVMPGVLIVEALAQAGGLIPLNRIDENNMSDYLVYFMAIENVKFRKPVVPGDNLILDVELLKRKRNIWRMKGIASVEGETACEAEFMAMIREKE